jgi:hypothetical protein
MQLLLRENVYVGYNSNVSGNYLSSNILRTYAWMLQARSDAEMFSVYLSYIILSGKLWNRNIGTVH